MPALQLQAAAALGMLAADSSNRRAIADAGGVSRLVQLLSSRNEETQVSTD
jgi:inhibitor of KinA sporulation pathway (predicted exonuclease)